MADTLVTQMINCWTAGGVGHIQVCHLDNERHIRTNCLLSYLLWRALLLFFYSHDTPFITPLRLETGLALYWLAEFLTFLCEV